MSLPPAKGKYPLIPNEVDTSESGRDSSKLETPKIAKSLGTYLEERAVNNYLI